MLFAIGDIVLLHLRSRVSSTWLLLNCRKREEVVEEVDDVISSQRKQHSRRTVDRSGRPSAEAAERSTGPIDRRARHAQQTCTGYCSQPARSTGAYGWSTDSRVGLFWESAELGICLSNERISRVC